MKKKNHFIAYMIAIMIMLFSMPVKAQTKTGYAEWDSTNKTLTFRGGNSVPGGAYSLDVDDYGPMWCHDNSGIQSNCTKVVFDGTFKEVRPTSCFLWFSIFKELQEIEGIENLNTEDVTIMNSMFNGCSKLTSLDLSSFNTSKVENTGFMFNGCSSLKTIYVSDKFKTDKVTFGNFMFYDCNQLVGAVEYKSEKVDNSMANYNTGYFKTYYKLGNEQVDLYGDNFTVDNLALSDDKNFVAHANFTTSSVSYTREITSTSKWYTLCLPFAYIPEIFTAYKLKSATDNSVEIEEMTDTIEAGTPIIFKFNGDDKNINITANDADIKKDPGMALTTEGGCQLCGTYQEKTFSSQDYNTFIIYKDRLMNPAKMKEKNTKVTTVGLKPFHAYMTMTSQTGASAKSFSIGSGDEETTAIDLLNSVATDDAEYYDINGSRIDAPVKGVNIVRRGNKTMKLIIK